MKKGLYVLMILFFLGNFFAVDFYYGMSMLKGQLNILLQTQPLEQLMRDNAVADSVKIKLQLVEEVRQFAIDSLGLKKTKSYNSIYDQQGQPAIWNISACQPFELVPYEWHFPVLGTVPYKGFFETVYAKEEFEYLQSLGLDVRMREAAAWSTLGIMNDPILTNFLTNDAGEIAELIIHELTHATIWVKGGVELNENLATFIGEHGAIEFLKMKYGAQSSEFLSYQDLKKGYEVFADHILKGALYLDSIYSTINHKAPKEKIQIKKEAITEIIQQIDTLGLQGQGWKEWQNRLLEELPNNAYFMSYKRYRSKQSDFEDVFEKDYNGNIREYLAYLKDIYEK